MSEPKDLPRIVVYVRGGVVQSVHSDQPVQLLVWDWDDSEDDPDAYNPKIESEDAWDRELDVLWLGACCDVFVRGQS